MKKIFFLLMMCFFAFIIPSCKGIFDNSMTNSNNPEVELAKVYVVHKLESALGVKIKFDTDFEAKTSLPITKVKQIFGDKLVNKFSDTLLLTFENQKVKTQIGYVKLDSLNCAIAIKRHLKAKIN